MLYRKIQKNISNWLINPQNALLITGARQVGKTFIIRETLKSSNTPFVEYNLLENKEFKEALNSSLTKNAEEVLFVLENFTTKKLNNNYVIFIDEIQESKEFVTAIKFLVEKKKYKFILSGSLLGVELTNLKSAPVGYLQIMEMFPMDLEEFFIANGITCAVIDKVKSCFKTQSKITAGIHEKLINLVYKYLIVGGMPNCVKTFIETGNLNTVRAIQGQIVKISKMDFTKHEVNKKLELNKIYDLIPAELNSHNKRFNISSINKNSRTVRYLDSFNWLIDSGVSIPVYNVTEFSIPLLASSKRNLFKLFQADVGLLTYQYGRSTVLKILSNSTDINCGSMFENLVAQELRSHKYETYYFNSKKHGEVDFLIEHDCSLLPIEVKSGKDYRTHSALTYFMKQKSFKKAIVFSTYNVSTEKEILCLPIYMVIALDNDGDLSNLKTEP